MGYTVDDLPEGSAALLGAFVARDYYGGMMTALYAMSSSGSLELVPGEGLDRIAREVAEALRVAEKNFPDDVDALQAFAEWIAAHQ
jgi:hypothetical protein